jgi:uncharacterized protein (DUF983 family)
MKKKEEKEKVPKYIILLFIVFYIFGIFLYINIDKSVSYGLFIILTFTLIMTIFTYNQEYEIKIGNQIRNREILNRCINSLDNICNKLIYTNVKS